MIDILLATYNGEKYLKEQIDSILNQTYKEFRILIRDDGSTDETLKQIQLYMSKYPDKIFLVEEESGYRCSANNFMILAMHAESEYVMFCDQDDIWLPNKIEDTLNEMKKIENQYGIETPTVVFGNYIVVDEKLNEITNIRANQIDNYKLDLNHLLVQNYVTGCLMMVNKSLYSNIKFYSPEILMHDWWIAIYASSFGIIHHFDKELMLYRQHGKNFVGAVDIKSFKYRLNKIISPNTKNMKWLYKKQAEKFLLEYRTTIPTKQKAVIVKFVELYGEKLKLKRIYCLLKGKYLKGDLIRILGQLIYI